jgi:hypothetical protein
MNITAMPVWHVTRMEINKRRMQVVKNVLWFLLILGGSQTLFAQSETERLEGEVSYKSSQTIYVKFASTQDIAVGDTLFLADSTGMTPVLIVKNKSSISCTGRQISDHLVEIGTKLVTRPKVAPQKEEPEGIPVVPAPEERIPTEQEADTEASAVDNVEKSISQLTGRISAAAYFNFSENPQGNKQRMRYTLVLNANRINNSRFSAETYMSFRHTLNEWDEVQQNFKRAFRVYNLALRYDTDNGTRFWAGRKINFSIANIGAIDGVQGEKKWKKMLVGAFAGSRPDHSDYSYNPNLFQYGVYVGHQLQGANGWLNTTVAFVDQKNNGKTDRRYIYFQHQNSMIKRFNLFTSFDFDLYTVENGQPKSMFDITSLFVSLRYKASKNLSFFGSYDSRNNVIYYETYKNTIDQLLEDETRRGFRFSFNYRPWKRVTIGSNAGYRYQKDSPSSHNLNNYIRFSSVPGIKASVTASVVLIQSAYLKGTVFGARISRDIVKGKLFGQLEARKVQYRYNNIEVPLNQSILGLNLSWRLTKKLSIAVNFEGEFQNRQMSGRVYTNLIKRL